MNGPDTYGPGYTDAPWDSGTWNLFESHAGKKVSIVHWGVPAPWTVDFDYQLKAHQLVLGAGDLELVDMSSGSVPLRDIAGGLYDGPITSWMQQAKAWGHPFFLRWDWEMNGSWFPWGTTPTNQNTPADYIKSWQHIHDIATQVGATNVTWVWCPNTEFTGSTPLEQLYPGDAYVDWTCTDVYNGSTVWTSFSSLLGPTYTHLLEIAPDKPVMIGETSSLEGGGSKATWIRDALSQLPTTFPQVRALNWFNWRINQNGGWNPWPIESSAAAQQAFAAGISSSYFAPGGTLGTLPSLTKILPN
jgi:hypothetical protein